MPAFFDDFFVATAITVGVLVAADWAIGPDLRERIRQKAGDFWTNLQYSPIDQMVHATLGYVTRRLQPVFGRGDTSRALVASAAIVNCSLLILWFVFLSGSDTIFGSKQIVEIENRYPRFFYSIALIFLYLVLLLGWLPYKFSMRCLASISSAEPTWARYLSSFAILAMKSILFVAVYLFSLIFFVEVFLGPLVAALVPPIESECLDGYPNSWACQMDEGWRGLALEFMIFSALFFSAVACLTAGLFPVLLTGVLLVSIAVLKAARRPLQAIATVVLQRLYESKQGILTQIALGIGFVAKLVQEVAKYLYSS